MNIKTVDTFYLEGFVIKGLQEHEDRISVLEKEVAYWKEKYESYISK